MLMLRPQTAMRTRRGHMTCGCQGSPSKGPARATRHVVLDPTASVPNAPPKERTGNALPGVARHLCRLSSDLSKTAQKWAQERGQSKQKQQARRAESLPHKSNAKQNRTRETTTPGKTKTRDKSLKESAIRNQKLNIGTLNLQGGSLGTEGLDQGKTDQIVQLVKAEKLHILALQETKRPHNDTFTKDGYVFVFASSFDTPPEKRMRTH